MQILLLSFLQFESTFFNPHLKFLIESLKLLFGTLALRDVVGDMNGTDMLSLFVHQGSRGNQEIASQPLYMQFCGMFASIRDRPQMGADLRRTGCPVNSFMTMQPDTFLGFDSQRFCHRFINPQELMLVADDRNHVRNAVEGAFPFFFGPENRFISAALG